jgi:hypothetical protein
MAAKRDQNEPEIVRALELAGWSVFTVSDTGLMDLLCIRRGVIRLLEVKGPKGKLTPAQEKTFARIHAALGTVHVVRTPSEALHAVALGVESELGPLESARGFVMPPPAIQRQIEESQRTASVQLAGYRVTPAYQKAQTESVVPKRRKKA